MFNTDYDIKVYSKEELVSEIFVRGITRLTKLNYDEWYYDDTNNISSGKNVDSRFAAHCLQDACIFSRVWNISIM